MVVTRMASGGGRGTAEGRSVYVAGKRKYTRRKVYKEGDEHAHDDDHQSPQSAPQIPDALYMKEGTTHPSMPTAKAASVGADALTPEREDNVASNINSSQKRVICGSQKNSSQPSFSLNLTEIAEKLNVDDGTEVDSLSRDDGLLSIRGYKVKPQYVDLLGAILSKYGDIAANCSDKPVTIRSFYVEYICLILTKLKKTNFVSITRTDLEEILDSLTHIEREHVEVGWLKERVQNIYEAHLAIPVLRPTSDVKQTLVQKKAKILSIKQQLAIKQAHITQLEAEIQCTNSLLLVEEEEVKKMEAMLSDCKAKLKHVFDLESLAESLI